MDTSTIVSGLFSIETKRTSASTMDTVDTSDGEYSNPDEHETAVSDVPEEIGDSVPTEEADDLINNREEELGSDDVAVDDGTHTDSAKEDASSTDEKAESAQNVVEMDGEASPCKEETTASIDGSEVAVPNSTDDREPPEQVEDRNEELEHKKDAEPTETAPPCVEDEVTRPVARIFPKTSQHRIPSRAAIKVIKGEIHNVLTVLRDQRYVSRSRFTQEIVEDDEDLNSTSHPVVQALQDLHTQVTAAAELVAMQPDLVIDVDYLEPFCQCIELPEISAVVTGKALGSLHKFVLYGFVSPSSSSISYQGNKEPLGAVMRIAEALLSCTFEETVTGVMANQGDADNSDSGGAPNHLRPVGNRSLAHLRRRKAGSKDDLLFDDEQTVLKLLDVAALVVRTSMQDDAVHLVQAPTISRLMDTCLHVSHRAEKATPLLKSAAFSALSQIVLQVFAAPGYEPVMQARREILEKLATLLNPKHTEAAANGDATSTPGKKAKSADSKQKQVNHSVVTNGLTLVNIALEACREPLTREEVQILQNDVCRYLLQWSHSSHDLSLLSLTLRVIFNLFQSIRNELKVPLEVFLTSIHMRIINDDSCVRHSPEEREVALESLVEFCQEPDMVQDIYLNYDCDVACSNLYEAIVTALGKAATPVGWEDEGIFSDESNADYTENEEVDMASKHSAHNSSDEGMAGRKISKKLSATESVIASNRDPAVSNQVSPVTHLHRLSMEGLLSVLESIAKRCTGKAAAFKQSSRADSGISEAESSRSWDPNDASQITTEELHERKRRKHALVKIGRVFNSSSSSSEWLDLAVKEGVLESKESVEGVADVLFTASMLDKAKVGIYLSKGPDDAYPFNAAVRQAFVGRYDFSDMTFAAALRKFLSKFRLPGEAQCIDRIMESFSKELYRQQGETSFFKSADAVFVLAFSTIMLNTDLHNPMIKQENRMTLEQFVKNNRGINDGEDLPEDFLVELYEQIKSKQIEVRKELGDIIKQHGEQEDFRKVWDNMLSKKGEVALPFFSQAGFSRSTSQVAGFHHKEMFIGLAKPAIQAFAGIFQRSWDDGLVVKALNGLQTICRVAAYFECGSILDDVLNILLPMGTDYVMNAIVTDRSGSQTVNDSHPDKEGEDDFDRNGLGRPIPYGLLCSYRGKEDVDITGSAYHRGLLALDCGFIVVRKYTARVVSAWPSFIECICALRDAHALPGGMTDLDDFADSNGNVLPQSTFAKTSQRRLHEVYRAHSEEEKAAKNKGWLRSIFRRNSKDTDELEDQLELPGKGNKLSKVAKALLEVAEASDVEAVVHLATGQSDVKRKIQLQIDCLDDFPFKHDPVGEQHAIFSIELATRALLSNRDHALEWFIPFLNKFEVVLSAVTSTKVPAPFVIERIVVTILRCCIHLYDIEEVS
jgi:brefeldin A-resistance guanine nucleotide exchange factor 1